MTSCDGFPLVCPVCQSALVKEDKTLRCSVGHTFDLARQGYVNLLLSHKKKSKHPGDDQGMVEARTAFLNQAYYAPFLHALSEEVVRPGKFGAGVENLPETILDVGCGEGYYTLGVLDKIRASATDDPNRCLPRVMGLDISKEAVIAACRRGKQSSPASELCWIVASGAAMPVRASSVDLLMCLFTRMMPAEFHRIIKPGGRLLVAGAGAKHLQEIRSLLYEEVREKAFSVENELAPQFEKVRSERIRFPFTVTRPEDLNALLTMTPHGWRTSPEKKARIQNLLNMPITGDIQIETWAPKPITCEREAG